MTEVEEFLARVAEFKKRLEDLQEELRIDLRHQDDQGSFLYFDSREGDPYPELQVSDSGTIGVRGGPGERTIYYYPERGRE